MRFYRGLQPFKIMSFDLDDTLYDNNDVIRLAEERFLQCVQEHAQLSELTSEYWREWKWQLAEKDPLIAEDVIAWRIETLRNLLIHHGKSAVEIDRTLERERAIYDVVGPVCETSDFLGKQRELAIAEGDYIAQRSAGAYGASMSSNYNSRPRTAEVLVDGDKVHLIRRRENLSELWALESIAE